MNGTRNSKKIPLGTLGARMDESKTIDHSTPKLSTFGAGSVGAAIMTLAKGTLGAGILALPMKTMFSGVPLFLVLLAVSGYFTACSVEMIAKGAQKTGKFVFEEITESLLGRKMAIVLGISMLLNCYGASIVFVIAIKDAFGALLVGTSSSEADWSVYATLIVGGAILVPLSILEKLNSLRILSLAGVLGVFFTVGSVVYALAYLGVSESFTTPPHTSVIESLMVPTGHFMEIMTVISTVTFAFCNQFNVPQMYGELKHKRASSVRVIAYVSTLLPLILYVATALCGYLCYGFDIKENIFQNFSYLVEQGKILIWIGIAAVVLSVSLCHLLNNFPMRLSVIFFLPERFHENKWIRYSVPLFTSISTVGIALGYANLSAFLGLVGASTGSIICYIVPALFSMKVDALESGIAVDAHKQTSVFSQIWYRMKRNPVESLMIIMGIVIGIVGTFSEFYLCFKPKN